MSGYAQIVRFFLKKIKNDHVGAYASQATLFIVMSAIPFMLILAYFLRFTPITEETIIWGIQLLMPNGTVPPMAETIVQEIYANSGKLLIPAFIITIFSAAKAVQSLRYGLNKVYDIPETRNWFVLRFRAMWETFLIILIIFALMLLVVFGKNIHDVLVVHAPIAAVVVQVILKLRIVIVFFILIPFFCFIYRFLPNRRCSFKSQLVGAIGCAASWFVFTGFFMLYILLFDGFSFYGSFTVFLLAVFWLNICLYIFLVCGAVNSMLEILWAELKETHRKNKLAKERGEEAQKREKREPSSYGQYLQEQEDKRKAQEAMAEKQEAVKQMARTTEEFLRYAASDTPKPTQRRTMDQIVLDIDQELARESEREQEHPSSKG